MSRVSGKSYFVYVLWSPGAKRFYIGITEDIDHRLAQHNKGLSRWTARHRPWSLVFQQPCADYTTARKLENELKRQKGGRGFFEMTGLTPERFSGS